MGKVIREHLQSMEDVQEGKDYHFPKEEEVLLEHWAKTDAFKEQLRRSKDKPEFIFYDGPPFATGLPHYGHLLAGSLKDIVTRYASQTGHHVQRRFGWDCHGLPVEYEIDKKLGIKSREDVLKMGIGNYNEECRSIVMKYSKEWEKTVTRLGRWIDFENDYKTMDPSFMESVWWVFSQLWEKGLVYKGFKVMPYSTGCTTTLSNFEAGQNYKDVDDPAVTVAFVLDDDPDEAQLVAWTTTPWTLPSNLALCVNPDFEYVKVRNPVTGAVFILLESQLDKVPGAMPKVKKGKGKAKDEPPEKGFEIIGRLKGRELEGRTYEPLFPYYERLKASGAFRVVCDGYVTATGGTGVVHQAPAFGEDDYRVALANGIVQKGDELPCPMDADGRLTEPVTDFAGQYVKDADRAIVARLKGEGRIVNVATEHHSYPFCWRSDTPLIYKATPSWFVRVTAFKDRLLANNKMTEWVPPDVRDRRFHNWLENAHDWAVSRTRFWGTPIPLWISEDGQETVVIGSVAQLEELSGQKITDLHRHFIDDITIPSREGRGPLRRVDDVFDCWFESGSMPVAQIHYPFENKDFFEANFPADFVAEGIDQTRGWFYTLMVLSTALFDKPTFKHLVCNGLVLAADGKKMSKRLKNYPDPNMVLEKYGADALRLYLINSPVVAADTLKFREEGVFGVVRDVFLPWYNAYRFLVQNVRRWQMESGRAFDPTQVDLSKATNVLDRWVHGACRILTNRVRTEMDAYRLYTVVPKLVEFIEQLTNIYVRYNRKRLKGRGGGDKADDADCLTALTTLYDTLLMLCKVMSPFTPFFTEHMYLNLRRAQPAGSAPESVHFCDLPPASPVTEADTHISKSVEQMQRVIELARVVRERHNRPVKTPLRELVVVHPDESFLSDIAGELNGYVVDELNVRSVVTCSQPAQYSTVRAVPQWQVLGKRLGKGMGAAAEAIKQVTTADIEAYEASGTLTVGDLELKEGDLKVVRDFKRPEGRTEAEVDANGDGELLVVLDLRPDTDLQEMGTAREIVNRVQKMRKKAGLQATDPVAVFIDVPPTNGGPANHADSITAVLDSQSDYLREALGTEPRASTSGAECAGVTILQEKQEVRGAEGAVCCFTVTLARSMVAFDDSSLLQAADGDAQRAEQLKLWLRAKDVQRLPDGSEVVASLSGHRVQLRKGLHFR